mmetsp:Transcript_60346/g.141026  ORF Transcript_60346/g.141026 Transcript_60346/m.141026 type:complete len:80 (-) Transcript_60346:235-474(-)
MHSSMSWRLSDRTLPQKASWEQLMGHVLLHTSSEMLSAQGSTFFALQYGPELFTFGLHLGAMRSRLITERATLSRGFGE